MLARAELFGRGRCFIIATGCGVKAMKVKHRSYDANCRHFLLGLWPRNKTIFGLIAVFYIHHQFIPSGSQKLVLALSNIVCV